MGKKLVGPSIIMTPCTTLNTPVTPGFAIEEYTESSIELGERVRE
jgi:hypothetical protein